MIIITLIQLLKMWMRYGGAFSDSRFRYVNLPSNLTKLGYGTFKGSSIRSFRVPYGTKIMGEDVVRDCRHLEAFELPGSIKEISGYAFGSRPIEYPPNLKRIYLNCHTQQEFEALKSKLPEFILDKVEVIRGQMRDVEENIPYKSIIHRDKNSSEIASFITDDQSGNFYINVDDQKIQHEVVGCTNFKKLRQADIHVVLIDLAKESEIEFLRDRIPEIKEFFGTGAKIIIVGLNKANDCIEALDEDELQELAKEHIFYRSSIQKVLTFECYEEIMRTFKAEMSGSQVSTPLGDTKGHDFFVRPPAKRNEPSLSSQNAEPTSAEIAELTNNFREEYRRLTYSIRHKFSSFKCKSLSLFGREHRGIYDTWSLRDIVGFVVNGQANRPTREAVKVLNWFDEQGGLHKEAPQAVRYYHAELVEQLNQQNGPSL